MAGTTDTKKVISVEAIGLFADTEKKNMSSLQLSMYNYMIKVELATTTDSYVTQINDECVIRFGPNTEAVMRYMDNKGYPLKGSMKDNIESLRKYGKNVGLDSAVEVRDDIKDQLIKGGYKWI